MFLSLINKFIKIVKSIGISFGTFQIGMYVPVVWAYHPSSDQLQHHGADYKGFMNVTLIPAMTMMTTTPTPTTAGEFKVATSQMAHLVNNWPNFLSSPFVIRLNLLHPQPSLFLFGLLSPLWCFSTLVNYYFEVSFDLKVILCITNNDLRASLVFQSSPIFVIFQFIITSFVY